MMDGTAFSAKNNLGGRNIIVAGNIAESLLLAVHSQWSET